MSLSEANYHRFNTFLQAAFISFKFIFFALLVENVWDMHFEWHHSLSLYLGLFIWDYFFFFSEYNQQRIAEDLVHRFNKDELAARCSPKVRRSFWNAIGISIPVCILIHNFVL